MGEEVHGLTGQELVKIIRADSLGYVIYNKNSPANNKWETSDIKQLLNGAYLNKEDGNITAADHCYHHYDSSMRYTRGDCDYTLTGISNTYRKMIENVYWQVGAVTYPVGTSNDLYEEEILEKTSTTSKIGIMYASDYGFSARLTESCTRTTSLTSYSSACANDSWLVGKGEEWIITPWASDTFNVLAVQNDGSVNNSNVYYGQAYRPVLYLKSGVYVIDGNGTITNPFIIGL